MNQKCAVFSCKGLGDGMITMILSNNLHLNGYETTTFHDGDFYQLQGWFPGLPIEKFPKTDTISSLLEKFDKIFVSYDSDNSFIQALIKDGKAKFPDKIKVLNPSISRNFGSQPFYEDALFRRDISMVDNMENFCKMLGLKKVVKENGMKCPYGLISRKHAKEVIIHPTSAKKGKMWPKKKYLDLASKLKRKGFECVFVLSSKESVSWQTADREITIRSFTSLDELAKCVYEASFMIGNDSGIGHLASCLNLPTLSICRSKRTSVLWKPSWRKGSVIYPSELIPNISGFRIRDKFWKHFVTTRRVFKMFLKLVKEANSQ